MTHLWQKISILKKKLTIKIFCEKFVVLKTISQEMRIVNSMGDVKRLSLSLSLSGLC
jgi:hypothetical protein